MRAHPLALCLLAVPTTLWANDIQVTSRVAAATVFPDSATLTREATVTIPAGRHQLILTNMPLIDPASLRLAAPGVTLGAVRYREDFVPPRSDDQTAAISAAEAEVDAREAALDAARDAVAAIRIEAEAARARIDFLDGIGKSEGLAQASLDQLRDLSRMIGEEGLAARRAVQEAEGRARAAQGDVEDAEDALADAKQALAALDTEAEDRAYLTVEVQAAEPAEIPLTLTYQVHQASWTPAYDVRLTTGDAPALTLDRGAYVRQATGENWTGVALTLSTVQPSGQGVPGEVWPWLRRIFDKAVPVPMPRATFGAAKSADMVQMEAPVMVEETSASAYYNGLSVTYSYPDTVSIANGADAVKIALGSLEMEPEVFARAVPLSDQTAYLTAGFTNDTGELIFGADQAMFYLDGVFVGQRYMEGIAEGDEAEFSFGPIEGLRLERIVKDRQEGDRGVITRSNQEDEEVVITLRNLTAQDWDVRLSDRVPYSEQEDLEITWQAQPAPAETDVDGKRGVLEWRFDMAPRTEQEVTLTTRLKWPEDKVLQ